jgi:hypothetical protein
LLAAACLTDLYREYFAGGGGSESADIVGVAQRLFAQNILHKTSCYSLNQLLFTASRMSDTIHQTKEGVGERA